MQIDKCSIEDNNAGKSETSKDKGVRQRNLSGAFFDMPDSQEVCMGRKFDDLSLEEKIAHFDGKRRAGGHH